MVVARLWSEQQGSTLRCELLGLFKGAVSPLQATLQIHPDLPTVFDYNVSHDSSWIVLASLPPSSSATRIGVDVMRVRIPWEGETVDQFVEGLQDQVGIPGSRLLSRPS